MNNTQDMDSGSGFGALLPMGLGLLGLVLGGAGLYFGLGAKSQLGTVSTEQAALREQIAQVDGKLPGISAQIQTLQANGPEALRTELTQKMETLVSAINENRRELNETRTSLAAVAKATPARASGKTADVATTGGAATPVPAHSGPADTAPAAAGTHTIAKGEYFATVAKKYGVPVAALEKLNPGVDSRKLKVGQSIKVPTK